MSSSRQILLSRVKQRERLVFFVLGKKEEKISDIHRIQPLSIGNINNIMSTKYAHFQQATDSNAVFHLTCISKIVKPPTAYKLIKRMLSFSLSFWALDYYSTGWLAGWRVIAQKLQYFANILNQNVC